MVRGLTNLFKDAQRAGGAIVLEDIELLTDYCRIGRMETCNNMRVLQSIKTILREPGIRGKKILLIGTTSEPDTVRESLDLTFDEEVQIEPLTTEDLEALGKLADVEKNSVGYELFQPKTIRDFLKTLKVGDQN